MGSQIRRWLGTGFFRRQHFGPREEKLTLVLLGCLALAALFPILVSSRFKRETHAGHRKSVLQSSSVLAAHFRGELSRIRRTMLNVAEQNLAPNYLKFQTEHSKSPGQEQSPKVSSVDSEPALLDFSLWEGDVQNSGMKRVFSAINHSQQSMGQFEFEDAVESALARQAFRRSAAFATVKRKDGMEIGLVAVSLPQWRAKRGLDAAITAHLDLRLFKIPAFTSDPFSYYVFNGNDVVHREGATDAEAMVFPTVFNEKRGIRQEGSFAFRDFTGQLYMGAFHSVGFADVSVAIVDAYEARGLGILPGILLFLALSSLFGWTVFAVYFWNTGRVPTVLKRAAARIRHASASMRTGGGGAASARLPSEPEYRRIATLHVGIHDFNRLADSMEPEDLLALLNDFFTMVRIRVQETHGFCERFGDTSMMACWILDGMASARSIECAISIRNDLSSFNESRNLDGSPNLNFGIGAHVGMALLGELHSDDFPHLSAVGEAVACARSLMYLTQGAGVSLLVSQNAWDQLGNRFEGEVLMESRLTQDTGVTRCFSVSGCRESSHPSGVPAQEVFPEGVLPGALPGTFGTMIFKIKEIRWSVNNGSQIIGPFPDEEIAKRLFAQELDFDSECWSEANGRHSRISSSGMFEGSEEEDADLWVFDGRTIHGPFTRAFVRGAMAHGAIKPDSWVCERSTVQGWHRCKDYLRQEEPLVHSEPTGALPKKGPGREVA